MADRHPSPDRRALLGHDIRAAVSDVIGGLRLIDQQRLPETEREQLGRVHVASELLARLVEELLNDSAPPQVEQIAGNLNLHRFLEEELRRWRGAARPSDTVVRLSRGPDLPEVVRLNGLHLRRVLSNLMGNALRYAAGGEVVLGAELSADGELSLCVTDDGPGFPEAMLPDLFQPQARGRASMGSGLGLHIASAHAEGLGGVLTAVNRPEGGARTKLVMPRAAWERPVPPAEGDLPDLTGRRILVADDSGTNQMLIRTMLERMGAESEGASDGVEALNWLARERFDLAIVDLEMPNLGGLDVIRSERLRQARGVAPPMAILAMTAYVLNENRQVILDAGADDILSKPLHRIEPFGAAVAQALDRAPPAGDWKPDLAPPLSAATLAELMRAAGPEHDTALLDRLREDLAGVETRLGAAIDGDDLAGALRETHVLLSLVGAVGALPTQHAARRLNRLLNAGDPAPVRIAGKVCLGRLAQLRYELRQAR